MANIQVQGLDHLYERLAKLKGENVSRTSQRLLIKALKQTYVPAMKGVAQAAFDGRGRGPNHGPAGRLVKAIDARVAKPRAGEMGAVKVGPGGKRGGQKAWYAHMVVGGTEPHLITASGIKSPTASRIVRQANRGAMSLNVAGRLVSVVHHPGAQPKPFPRQTVGLMHGRLAPILVRELIAASEP